MRRFVLALSLLASGALLSAACNDPLRDPSAVTGVRVLGVRLDPPLAKPGETVHVEALVHDGRAPLDAQEGTRVLWIRGCDDPPDDAPGACYERLSFLRTMSPEALAGPTPSPVPEGYGLAWGTGLDVPIAEDLVEKHAAADDTSVRIGLSYLFFVACRGAIVASQDERPRFGIPLECVDAKGARVSQDDVVVGYATLRAHPSLRNQNPSLGPVALDGRASSKVPCADDAACPSGEACGAGRCLLALSGCTASDEEDCPVIDVRAPLSADSVEDDDLSTYGGTTPKETLTLSYFTTTGGLDEALRSGVEGEALASDAQRAGHLRLHPAQRGVGRVWVVVRDGRGGTSWSSEDVVVR